jgi:hypothetical protein
VILTLMRLPRFVRPTFAAHPRRPLGGDSTRDRVAAAAVGCSRLLGSTASVSLAP